MEKLFNIVAEMVFELPAERLEFIAEQAEKMYPEINISGLKQAWGVNRNSHLYENFFTCLRSTQISGKELAIAIRSASLASAYSKQQGEVELLWTGPITSAVPLRCTEQALCELINTAQRKIFIVCFVAYKVNAVVDALKIATSRNVEINFLLEKDKEAGGSVEVDSIQYLRAQIPKAKFYVWNPDTGLVSGSVHAKCAVADGRMALITSANLTGRAMESNMELGVILRNGNLPLHLHEHLEGLISERIIIPI